MSEEDIEAQRTRSSISFMTHGSLLFSTIRYKVFCHNSMHMSRSLPTTRTSVGKRCLFALLLRHQDFVSQLCRLGGQSPYLWGQFWFILCSDILPHRTLTWSTPTDHNEG